MRSKEQDGDSPRLASASSGSYSEEASNPEIPTDTDKTTKPALSRQGLQGRGQTPLLSAQPDAELSFLQLWKELQIPELVVVRESPLGSQGSPAPTLSPSVVSRGHTGAPVRHSYPTVSEKTLCCPELPSLEQK